MPFKSVFVCLYNYEFWLSLCKIVRSSVILLLPLFERNPLPSSPSTTDLKIWASSNGRFDWLNRFDNLSLFIKSHVKSRDVPKKITKHLYDLRFSRRFVLVRVAYLSSSQAHTNNRGVFGKENYLPFDWWKHFMPILRRSKVTINLTRPLKKIHQQCVD
jgi:hypothetical protein